MKIVTWNVNSLKARHDFVSLYLKEEAPDVLGIQELKLTEEAVPRALFEEAGYEVAIFGQKQWNGVLLASKKPMTDITRGLGPADEGEARAIAATIDGIRVINLYCPQGQRVDSPKFPYKLRFYDALIEQIRERDPAEPLILMGDLNIAPEPRDIWDPEKWAGTPTFHPEEHLRYQALLDWGLEDVVKPHIGESDYSFWDYRGGSFPRDFGMRIDHILVTEPLRSRVKGAGILREWRRKRDGMTPSDHVPVYIELSDGEA